MTLLSTDHANSGRGYPASVDSLLYCARSLVFVCGSTPLCWETVMQPGVETPSVLASNRQISPVCSIEYHQNTGWLTGAYVQEAIRRFGAGSPSFVG